MMTVHSSFLKSLLCGTSLSVLRCTLYNTMGGQDVLKGWALTLNLLVHHQGKVISLQDPREFSKVIS